MMSAIDLRTLVGMAAFSLLLLTFVTYAAHRGMRRQVHGLLHWANGGTALFVSGLLFAGRGFLPDWLSVVAANGLFLFALALWAAGTLRFLDRPVSWRHLFTVALAGTAVLAWFLYGQDEFRLRLVVFTFACTILVAMQVVPLLRFGDGRLLTRIFTGALCLQLLVFALRGATAALSISTAADLFTGNAMQMIYLGLTQFLALVLMLGFFLLAARRLHDQLEHLARRDALTQILNRRAFFEAMETEFTRARRGGRSLSIVMLDLDQFKRLNDGFGHEVGDLALQRVAALVPPLLRAGDAFGRIGGEEFAILLPEAPVEAAGGLAERIRAALEEGLRSQPAPLTASLGVATLQDADADARQLLRRADGALYAAKAAGRNRAIQA